MIDVTGKIPVSNISKHFYLCNIIQELEMIINKVYIKCMYEISRDKASTERSYNIEKTMDTYKKVEILSFLRFTV